MKKAITASLNETRVVKVVAEQHGTISYRQAFWVVAYAFAVTLLSSTLPTPLYVVYQHLWHFSSVTLSLIFATYALGVLFALLWFGRISDQIGRRRVLLSGLIIAVCGAILFVLAQNIVWLFAARFMTGIAVGLATGTATATLVELYSGKDTRFAALIGTASSAIGFGLGPLVTGLLAQYAPLPTHLVFFIYLVLLMLALFLTRGIPETVQIRRVGETHWTLRPQRLSVPKEIRGPFVLAAITLLCGFGTIGLFTALAPSLVINLLHMRNLAVSGSAVALIFAMMAIAQLSLRRLTIRQTITVGMLLLITGLCLMLLAFAEQSLLLFLISIVFLGIGPGLAYMGSLELANRIAPSMHRAEVLSSYFVVGYLGNALPALGVGIAIGLIGSFNAIAAFVVVIGLLSLTLLISALVQPRLTNPS
ncbi:MAG TPA: MFS transporter [Ktedonobacter sp.]|nr:MFS transporter [Ktedonobacter sp.]